MNFADRAWIDLGTCAGLLALSIGVAVRGTGSRLALPLVLFCADLFTWNLASFVYRSSGVPAWHGVDIALSPWMGALGLHVVLLFVGEARALRVWLVAAYGTFGGLSLWATVAWLRGGDHGQLWSIAYLAAMLAVLGIAIVLLRRHRRIAFDAEEVARTRLLLWAFSLGPALGLTELLADVGVPVPNLGGLGTLVTGSLVSAAALRFRLLDRAVPIPVAIAAICLGALGVGACVVVLSAATPSAALVAIALAVASLASFAGLRALAERSSTERSRRAELAMLGRFTAQMAHDLKNPLAALKGAVQFLQEERQRGRSLDDSSEMFGLVSTQVERLGRIIDQYQRLGRAELAPSPIDVGLLIERVAASERARGQTDLEIDTHASPELPHMNADGELLSIALENLVRNASEAMPRGGTIVVRVEPSSASAPAITKAKATMTITVEDTGIGMNARVREQALDDFYTTKPHGTGLGLAFVRRVVRAHGGSILIDSAPGRGTVVRIVLPLAPTAEHVERV